MTALIALCALALCVGIAPTASGHWLGGGHGEGLGRCFPAGKWGPARDGVRPCVKVTRIFEDGSFTFRVSDADGTERYTSGVGALDR